MITCLPRDISVVCNCSGEKEKFKQVLYGRWYWKLWDLVLSWHEPRHDKTNKMAVRPAKTDQPGHPPSQIRVFTVRINKALVLSYPLSARRSGCPGWSESSLGAHSLYWFCHVSSWSLLIFLLCLLCIFSNIEQESRLSPSCAYLFKSSGLWLSNVLIDSHRHKGGLWNFYNKYKCQL